jgi:dTDP-glucose 4,6-dehydratase
LRRILVAGGAGFIGSNFVRHVVSGTDWRVRVLDKLTYAGNLANFPDSYWKDSRFEFVRGDVCDHRVVRRALEDVDAVVNFVAETHIDRSIDDVSPFVRTDFVGTYVLLDEFRSNPCDRFVQISTCEVYGSARQVPMTEDHPIEPQSPYAATKAGADRLCYSFFRTYGLPIVILRPFNAYGPNQYPEKVVPFFFTQALQSRPLFVYGSGRNTRDWTYVEDLCGAVARALRVPAGRVAGQVFNVGSGEEWSSLDIAEVVLGYLGRPASLLRHIQDRPGHVERLVCGTRKTSSVLGWKAGTRFDAGLEKTLDWYAANAAWWRRIMRRKQYQDFYRRWYEQTLGAREEPKAEVRRQKSEGRSAGARAGRRRAR